MRVLTVASQLVDSETTDDQEVADPYVVALALEVAERCPRSHVYVATNDNVDRLPLKLSLATACARLGVDCWTAEEFVEWITP